MGVSDGSRKNGLVWMDQVGMNLVRSERTLAERHKGWFGG